MGNETEQIQIEKYKECLMHVNNDLGMLIQNAENLAYKLGAIKSNQFHYKAYDHYNQFDKKDIWTLRKNILSSLRFLEAQFIAIKQETRKEYIFPPSIEKIKYDVKNWKKIIENKSPEDVKYYNAILSMLEKKKYTDIAGAEEVYKICNANKKSDATPYMWMYMSPPILNHIDKNSEKYQIKFQSDKNFMPDIHIDNADNAGNNDNENNMSDYNVNEDLISSNDINKEIREINNLLEECKDYKFIKKKIEHFKDKHKKYPYIEEKNYNLYDKIMNDMK